jgi:hypothetical protein
MTFKNGVVISSSARRTSSCACRAHLTASTLTIWAKYVVPNEQHPHSAKSVPRQGSEASCHYLDLVPRNSPVTLRSNSSHEHGRAEGLGHGRPGTLASPLAFRLDPNRFLSHTCDMRLPNWMARFTATAADGQPSRSATRRRMRLSPDPGGSE